MNLSRLTIVIFCITLLLSCRQSATVEQVKKVSPDTKKELSGNFRISGAFALYPLVNKWIAEFNKEYPNVKITLSAGGTGQGIDDIRKGSVQLAMISRPLTDEELADSIWTIPVAKAGVAPIVNQQNPNFKDIVEHGITPQKLIQLFTADNSLTWGDLLGTGSKDKLTVYTRADESGAAVVWANFLWKESKDLKGVKVTGDDEMIKGIQGNKLAIGYCNFSYAFDTVSGDRVKDIQVLPIDLDFDRVIDKKEIPFSNINKAHRGLWLGYYPKNLTRELTIGSIGKPHDKAITEFLHFILTKGQTFVGKTGFCELNDVYIKSAFKTID